MINECKLLPPPICKLSLVLEVGKLFGLGERLCSTACQVVYLVNTEHYRSTFNKRISVLYVLWK